MNKQGSSSKNHHPSPQNLSSTTSSSPVIIPTPPSTEEVEPDDNILMDTGKSSKTSVAVEAANNLQPKQETPPLVQEAGEKDAKSGPADKKQKTKPEKKGSRATKTNKQKEESSASESSSDDSLSDSENSDSSEDERAIRKKKKLAAKKAAEKKKAKQKEREKAKKKKKKSRKYESSDDSSSESDSDSDSDSEDEKTTRKKKAAKAKRKKKMKSKRYESSSEESSSSFSSSSESDSEDEKKRKKKNAKQRRSKVNAKTKSSKKAKAEETSSSSGSESDTESTPATSDSSATLTASNNSHPNQQAKVKLPAPPVLRKTKVDITKTDDKPQQKKKNVLEFKRVDQVWDSKIRDYKYTESVEEQKDEFDSVFTVRRRFGWDNKYIETQVDIKSKLLRNVLQTILKDCKSISLVEDKPSIQPHMLFHYYEEIKSYVKKTLKPKLKKAKKRKDRKQLEQQIAQSKLLLRYIDEDYEETRNALEPMLNAGTITYNLVWALFKPNTIAYTPTYGNKDDPRCFKVDHCYEEEDWFGNKKWSIEGRYLEYDGKVFGLGDHFVQIGAFKGPRKISNLAAYPLDFHKDPENLREQLIERGKKFVSLQGMNYRFHKGLGYMKVKRSIAKININGRVMIDPAIFRRINPNYPLSYIKQDELGQDESGSEDSSDEGCSDEDGDSEDEKPKGRMFMWKDKQGKKHVIHIPVSDKGPDITAQKLDNVEEESDEAGHVFTEEELLIASPVVLGFTFSEKLWLEFSLSGINEIEWNDEAFDNLVISKQTKQNLKGLVSSHRFNAAKTIDDVIVGKGKGLNVVLHGPPGVGKTLTGESIAEYLRCPLYAVSSGELGTNAAQLERDLNRIMDITHSWGAILLLDEADVFLEARQPHDIHRNALVSVFLRLTEYYQGILFLTTNRVSTFDEAFQSRIHMGIRYENLTAKARKKIWQHHVGKVLQMADKDEAGMCKPFAESDYDELSKKVMNGRQIKNAVKTSQAIAISEKGIFGMEYVRRVMEAHETFEEDMKGGRGYRDAMRQYT